MPQTFAKVISIFLLTFFLLLQVSKVPPRRRVPTRAHPVSSNEPEQMDSGPNTHREVTKLRAQAVGLLEAYWRQN